jgi:multidrug efflux pump subunit AcrA (membrane-fusion protein)
MNPKRYDLLIASVLCTCIGLAAGAYAVSQGSDHADGHAAAAGEADAAGDPHDEEMHFETATLANLGVAEATLTLEPAARTRTLVATVVETAATRVPLRAPTDGVVVELLLQPGQLAQVGQPIARVVRSPIPLPTLPRTMHLVHPEHGEIHASIRSLREARADQAIATRERARVESFVGGSAGEAQVVPGQRLIDLQATIDRAAVQAAAASHELERHGFSREQIESVAEGREVALFDAEHARRALVHAGMFGGLADALLEALPETIRSLPLAVGAIAELEANGQASSELTRWLASEPRTGLRFLEVASLLLSGSGLADVERLADLGALEPTYDLRAPAGAPDWDLESLAVQAGTTVRAGDAVAHLRDPRHLRLRIDPLGSELGLLRRAMADGAVLRAAPLVADTGPVIDSLQLDYVASATDGDGTVHAFAPIVNFELARRGAGAPFRSWAIEVGTRYRVLVPLESIEEAFVLPRAAVTADGPDQIVFLPHGDGGFDELPVQIAFRDEDRVVLRAADNPGLKPGNRVVVAGAFELGLAMHAGEADAGHHHHDH